MPIMALAQLKNWHMDETMRYYADYDFDLEKITSQPIEANVRIIIDIGANGEGRFVTYIGENKNVFSISSATSFDKEGHITHIKCQNLRNQTVPAGVKLRQVNDGNYVISQVWITNPNKMTALLFYND